MIFITGAANVGKTSLVNQLKRELPSAKFDIHDIDETGRWSGDYIAWRNEIIEHWLRQSIVNNSAGTQTILCGIISPEDVCKLTSHGESTDVVYILLDATADDIYSRFKQKRLKNSNKLFQDNGALHVAAQIEVAKRLKKSVQQNHGLIIDTHNKTKEEVAEQVLESIRQL